MDVIPPPVFQLNANPSATPGQPTTPEPATLTREQLLAALDTEIHNFEATKSSTGHTRWALALSISGLLWLGIQIWDNTKFSPRNVALLAIALTLSWDFILKFRGSLDSSLLPSQPTRGRFFAFSYLLGALRSTIFFFGLKQAAILAAIFWLASPGLYILKLYFLFSLVGVVLAFVISYIDLPPIPALDAPTPVRFLILLLQLCTWLVRITVAGVAIFILCQFGAQFTAADVRLGIIIAAFGYLLTLLVDEQFPASHLAALRSVRQNLAFARITSQEAQIQIDLLLLVGGGVANTVRHTPDSILATAEQVRSNYAQIESLLPNYQKLAAQMAEPSNADPVVQTARTEYDRLHKFLGQIYSQATTQHDRLLKRVKKFEEHVQFIAYFSASAAREAEPLIEKLKVAFVVLADQRQKLKPVLSVAKVSGDVPPASSRHPAKPIKK